jgi:hypothetical protein
MKGLIKHADIHLRIRTLIAEAGRELRAATQTIEDEKADVLGFQLFCRELLGLPLLRGVAPKL